MVSDTTHPNGGVRSVDIFRFSHDAIIDATIDGRIADWNPAAEQLYGYSREEVIGKSIMLISPMDRVDEIEVILAKARAGQRTEDYESVRVRKDGTKVSVLLTVSPVEDADGVIVGACAITRDLTDRRKADAELRRRAAIVESSNDMIVEMTLDGIITSWNPAAQRIHGFSSKQAIGRTALLMKPKDPGVKIRDLLAKVAAGEPTEPYESVQVRKDGAEGFVSFVMSPVKDADGTVISISAIGRDVTDRHRAEQGLRRMAAIVESSNDAIVDMTLDGVITSWNPAAERLYDLSSQDAIGKSGLLIEPSGRAEEIKRMLATVGSGRPTEPYEVIRIRKDGTKAHFSFTISPVKDPAGVIIGVSAIGHDVTDRKRAEDTLRRMATIAAGSNDMIVDATLDGVITSWNPAAERLLGFSSDEVVGGQLALITSPHRAGDFSAGLANVMRAGLPQTLETVLAGKDGTEISASFTISPVRDTEGVIVGLAAVGHDLADRRRTDRRRSERELRRMATIVENSHDVIVELTLDGVVTSWNPAAERIYGLTSREVMDKPILLIEPKDRTKECAGILAESAAGRPTQPYDSVHVGKDGKETHLSFTMSPVRDTAGVIIGVCAIGRDVTRENHALREIADWRGKAFTWMEELERFQRLSVMRDFERELTVIDLKAEIDKLRGNASPDQTSSGD